MEAKAYAQGRADMRRLWLCFVSKWWILLLFVVTGALLGSGLNCLYRAVKDEGVKYKAEVKLYVEYATDERDEAYMYFNDYTWKTIIGTDEIMQDILPTLKDSYPGIAKEEIVAGLDAHTPSDIRVMIVTVALDSPEKADAVIRAIGKAVSDFGTKRKEFDAISIIDTIPAKLDMQPKNLLNAAVIGVITALIIGCACMLVVFSTDDRIMTETDLHPYVTETLVIYLTKGGNLSSVTEIMDAEDIMYVSAEEADKKNADAFSDGKPVVLTVTYKKTRVQLLTHAMSFLANKKIKPEAIVICDADERFLKNYFGRDMV